MSAIFEKQRANLITLGVDDLVKAKTFYKETLGFRPWQEVGDVVFFDMNGFILGLYPSALLAVDMSQANDRKSTTYHAFSLAYNARSEEEVNTIFQKLESKKVKIIKSPQTTDWGGYSGYFSDPDGHAWEVAYNPYWQLDAKGRVDTARKSVA